MAFALPSALTVALLCVLLAKASSIQTRPGPAAHYVIRSSNLRETLEFTSQVLGLSVLRHEENPAACPITCNGDFPVPWSKTMVGSKPENEAYALEITYNYGVDGYSRGTGLSSFEIFVEDVDKALSNAKKLGYRVHGSSSVVGPDGYSFDLATRSGNRKEPFAAVNFAVADPEKTAQWYVDTLGMEKKLLPQGKGVSVFFGADESEGVVFNFRSGVPVVASAHDGRNAFSLPAADVRRIYELLAEKFPERVVHKLQEINEETGLGVLYIAIVSDINGLEICLVSSEAFEPAIAAAYDGVGPDYQARAANRIKYRTALAKKNADMLAQAKVDFTPQSGGQLKTAVDRHIRCTDAVSEELQLTGMQGPGGDCELIRLTLKSADVGFSDVRLDEGEWMELKSNPNSAAAELFGKLPVIQHGDFKLTHRRAIEGYVADLALPSTRTSSRDRAIDAMFLDEHAGLQRDMMACSLGACSGKANEAMGETIRAALSGFERNIPSSGYIRGGDRPSIADLAMFDLYSNPMPDLSASGVDLSPYPKFVALAKRVGEYPAVAAYVEERGY